MSLKSDLEHIVTVYDEKQSKKKFYNIHAIALYLKRVDEVLVAIRNGKSVRDAVTDGFNDRLRDFILKNLEKRGHIEVSEDVQEFEYTDFDRLTRNKTRPVPARYADNALGENTVSYDPKTMKFSSSVAEDVQQYDYTDFDRQTRNINRHVPARYADNALALDEEFDVMKLDRLQKIMNDADVSDAEISRGIELSRLGYQRLAAQMGVNVATIQEMVNSLITKMRKEKESNTIMGEGYEELLDDKRFTYEKDALGSVTVRDGNSGHEIFLRGHEAAEFLSAIQSGAIDDQTLMGSYMPLEVIDEEVLQEGYEEEIDRNFGTYNFPWKIGSYKGTGTAEYSDEGIKIVSVRDDEGDEMNVDDQERADITKQAVAFIGSV